MGKRLSGSDIARYERDEFLFPIDMIDRDAARCREGDRVEALRYEAAP